MMNGWNTGMGWGFGGGLFSFILIAGAIVGIVFLVRWLVSENVTTSGGTSEGETLQSAEEILKSRYTQGEISRKEYLQLKSDIKEEKKL
jgi:putative membrane protein